MTNEQENVLRELVKSNEELKGPRVIIDYAIMLAISFYEGNTSNLGQEMTDFVEELYKELYPIID